jgi:hypothetical protein
MNLKFRGISEIFINKRNKKIFLPYKKYAEIKNSSSFYTLGMSSLFKLNFLQRFTISFLNRLDSNYC